MVLTMLCLKNSLHLSRNLYKKLLNKLDKNHKHHLIYHTETATLLMANQHPCMHAWFDKYKALYMQILENIYKKKIQATLSFAFSLSCEWTLLKSAVIFATTVKSFPNVFASHSSPRARFSFLVLKLLILNHR